MAPGGSLAENESARQVRGEPTLREIAQALNEGDTNGARSGVARNHR
jgi:hypothetical protein